jgi:elongation factor Ts
MMECKKALTEADGDMARAEEILRVKLGNKAGKAASRITAEGVVAAPSPATGALVEVNCETDFVSKNDSFLALAKAAAELVAEHNPADVEALGALPWRRTASARRGRRAQGPDRQDRREHVDPPLQALAGGGKLAHYLHGTRIGVVVEFDGDAVAAKDVAMHVAAMKPWRCPAPTCPPT